MFALVVRFDLKDAASALCFDALVEGMTPLIMTEEPDTLIYAVHSVTGAPPSRIFYELYASREGFEQHEANEHTKHFHAEREQYLISSRVEFLDAPTGKGVHELR